ncbi:MAG: aromatic ring-hydroxylating oxygenase subunit alpha [bacterium]
MNESTTQLLDAVLYADPGVFEKERDALFSQHWWLIGTEPELISKGEYITTTLGRFPIFVIRDENDKLNGFHNVCRHRAGPIFIDQAGKLSGNLLVCQYHGWCYNLQGQLKNAHRLNQSLDKSAHPLFPIRIAVWNKLVFACIDQDAPPLTDWLGDITEIAKRFPTNVQMHPLGIVEKTGATNWKCYGDNSCEGYHVGLVHKALGSSMDTDAVKIRCYEEGKFIGFDVTYSASAADPSRQGKGFWIYKFPGLLLHFSENTFNAESVIPLSERSIALKRWFWSLPPKASRSKTDPQEAVSSASRVMDEDLQICERVFENLSAGIYSSGVLSTTDEPGTQFFQKIVREFHRSIGLCKSIS